MIYCDNNKETGLKLLDNNKCILVEFVNETDELSEKLIQTGYHCWLEQEDALDIDNVINTGKVIYINWPKSVDVSTAATMRIKLKNVAFEKHPAKILAYSEWVQMRRKQSNLQLYNVISPSKSSRKILKRKDFEDMEEINDEPILKVKRNLDSNFKLDEGVLNLNESSSWNQIINHADVCQSSDDNTERNESSEDDNESSGLLQILKIRDKEILVKNQKIEQLENENRDLKHKLKEQEDSMDIIIKENREIKDFCTNLKKKYRSISEFESIVNSTTEDLHKMNEILNTILSSFEAYNFGTSSKDYENKENITLCNIENAMNEAKNSDQSSNDDSCLNVRESEGTKSKGRKYKNGNEPTDFVIPKEKLVNVKTGSVPEYTNSILEILFTDEELSSCSVTGTMSNVHKNLKARPGLDKNRLAAARNYCYTLFHKKTKDWYKTFNYTARNKCNDMKKLFK